MNQAINSQAAKAPITGLGFTLLDNGESVCLMFPYIPGATEARLVGQSLRIATDAGELVFDEIGSRARDAAAAGKLLAVGVDALSRPVFERNVTVTH